MLRWLSVHITTLCFRALRDGSAAVSPLMALMIIPIAGATAMATEMGQWYYFQRAMQNAADAAALAAAINNSDEGSTFEAEGKAAAAGFGFVDGQDSTTVAITTVTCPNDASGTPVGDTCYQADLTKVLPITLSALVGFRGDREDGYSQSILASAVATTAGTSGAGSGACIETLSNDSESFRSNGTPKTNLDTCIIISNGGATCNGILNADTVVTATTSFNCEDDDTSIMENYSDIPEDSYAGLAENIPANNCGGVYPVIPKDTGGSGKGKGKADDPLPSSNVLSGTMNISGTRCGDVQLNGDVTLTGSNTLTIFNGTLDLNGYDLKTESGASATIIFSGDNTDSAVRGPTNSGSSTGTDIPVLDIEAPTSGTWSGVAIYQDPRMSPSSSSLDLTYTGNDPTWNITGLVYLPKSDVTISGAVNKATDGASCFVLIAYTVLVSGEGMIFANSNQCGSAGLTPPGIGGATSEKLVR